MSADKYPSIFSHQMKVIAYIFIPFLYIYSINRPGHSFNFGTIGVGAYYSPYIFNKQGYF